MRDSELSYSSNYWYEDIYYGELPINKKLDWKSGEGEAIISHECWNIFMKHMEASE